jgi:hypothetical protein
VTLISGLQALAHVRVNPLAAGVPLAVAAIAFAALLRIETRRAQPLVDFGLFANRNFAIAAGLLSLVMFDIMTLRSTTTSSHNPSKGSACPPSRPAFPCCRSRSRCLRSRARRP